ncbi:Txe/YoeB family addiction module toxin [Fundidesulfovibrio agrisoli]|uniref:Txe/YoeB family addiction module toxin n=1 Tax=Fundidesulfovibrio agrisoli TaxID=2922717 RepID=UPI001FAC60A1|nr:Txe/YoeB family addiction module toxin [Fundidesulfovibrio agrisoli]
MSLAVAWTPEAWEDYLHWQATDKAMLRRINRLIKDIQRSPFEGLGKPEQLRFDLAGRWSRRIDAEHRLVYSVTQDMVIVLACRYHY